MYNTNGLYLLTTDKDMPCGCRVVRRETPWRKTKASWLVGERLKEQKMLTDIRPRCGSHLVSMLKKHGIMTVVEVYWVQFLVNVIDKFKWAEIINYVCVLHDYIKKVPTKAWPWKRKILEQLFPAYKKIGWKTKKCAKTMFNVWWAEAIKC